MLEQGYLCFSWRLLCSYKWLWQCKRLPWVPDTHNTGPEQRHCYQLCLGFSLSFFFFYLNRKSKSLFRSCQLILTCLSLPAEPSQGHSKRWGEEHLVPFTPLNATRGLGKCWLAGKWCLHWCPSLHSSLPPSWCCWLTPVPRPPNSKPLEVR